MMATPKDVADVLEAKAAAARRRQEQAVAAAQAQAAAQAKVGTFDMSSWRRGEEASMAPVISSGAESAVFGQPVTAATTTVTTSTAATSTAATSTATSTAATSTAATSTATSTAATSTAATATRTVISYKGVGKDRIKVTTVYKADGSVQSTSEEPDPDTSGDSSGSNPYYQLQKDAQDLARLDAFKLLEDLFTGYGLSELVPEIRKYMQGNIGPNEATLLLKSTAAYQNRFKGNQERLAKGLNVYSEADYIAHENEYSELFKQYGVTQFANRAEFAQLIGSDITKVDLNERLKLAVINVQNADPNIKAALKQYYPNITDADLVSYFLKPDQTLQSLQLKVSTADVAAAAKAQGLQVSGLTTEDQRARAEQIATILGPSSPEDVLAAARAGYQKVATVLPFAAKLSEIYGAQTSAYGQTQAETEFLLSDAEAARKRAGLSALEEAQFSGRSGIDTQVNPLGRSIQGAF